MKMLAKVIGRIPVMGRLQRDALRAERDTLRTERDSFRAERDTLQAEYDALRTEHDTLRTEHDTLRTERDALRTERDGLLAERDALRIQDDEAAAARKARIEGRLIITEYAYDPQSRPIHSASGGRRLTARLQAEEDCYAATLRDLAGHIGAMTSISRDQGGPNAPFWLNDWFPPFDGAALYGLISQHAPRRYIEVGSGTSTRFARQAISDLKLPTRIVSIDPQPRNPIDAICDEVIRSRMEDVPSAFWEGIGPEDMLFVDNSHRSFSNSDVTVFFTEVLPALQPGSMWGLHDIFLPWDYPENWRDRYYNEQYLLLSYLLGGADGDEIVLPVHWAASRPHLHDILAPLWEHPSLQGLWTSGGSFWMRRGRGIVQ